MSISLSRTVYLATISFALLLNAVSFKLAAQNNNDLPILVVTNPGNNLSRIATQVRPLQQIRIIGAKGKSIQVRDGKGKLYVNIPAKQVADFIAGGALGKHTVTVTDAAGKSTLISSFLLEAVTDIDDGGYYKDMFNLFYKGMENGPDDSLAITWNGKRYRLFVPWILDHCQTMKGLKYFRNYGAEFVDLMRGAQRSDGMIYSFVQHTSNTDYYLTRDKYSGYSKQIGDKLFTRQPTENHPEYLYVNTIYQCWKADGNDTWMELNLSSAARALDYTINDPARWSNRFGLLKRVYTIDSWDFAVEDEYMPDLGITNTMIIDPVKSKFGVFFGDNTGYISACYELAEMMTQAGKSSEAQVYRTRGNQIKNRLDKLAWNGRFFTHFIDEDSTVKRHLGVDEKTQIAQSNAYSLNRDISAAQSKAIIETYLKLKDSLPAGSPAEWYAIYPPFQKGFSKHNEVWQYMNGGVGGHIAGELARGAYANGYEGYATGILNRLFELGKEYDHKIWFAYTGAILPKPPAPGFRPLDISTYANMDHWSKGGSQAVPWMNGTREGDDLRNLPTGEQTFNDIRFNIIDAEKNNRRAVVAVSKSKGLPAAVEILVNDTAASVYLLHTSAKPTSENVVGAVIFKYTDGTEKLNYILYEKQLTYWWFSQLKTPYSGIAWYGKNLISEGVGLSWCAIDNPFPEKKIASFTLQSAEGNGIYAVFAITLSDQRHFVPVNPVSFGGPDNWAAATAMAGLVEGLAGVHNMPASQAFSNPLISPHWITTASDTVEVTVRFAASDGYVAYRYLHNESRSQLRLTVTGSGAHINCHVLLPDQISKTKSILSYNRTITFKESTIEHSHYADFTLDNDSPHHIIINY